MPAFHPFSTHFPIALLLTASALELLALRRGVEPHSAVPLLLRIGWWAGLLAMLTGTLDLVRQIDLAQQQLSWVNMHVGASLAALWGYWRLMVGRKLKAPARLRLHLFGVAMLIITGYLGGQMAHALGFAR